LHEGETVSPLQRLAIAVDSASGVAVVVEPSRYFLLTGQTLNAQKALELGLVAEVLPLDKLLARAWELAEDLARRPTLLLRYTRPLLTEALRRQMHDLLGYGLGMEMFALGEKSEAPA
jgi:enoyl-CoA hydratase/carnithine racemase